MIHTKDNIALADVPEGVYNLRIVTDSDGTFLCADKPDSLIYFAKELPPGSWRFVCLSTEMTEEKAREVVVRWGYRHLPIWKDYTNPNDWMPTALESFRSLLTALGCDPAGTYAVLINTNP